jgi:hypothetical protein
MDERHCKTCVCGCTCGFGGEHVEDSPRCALTTKERGMVSDIREALLARQREEFVWDTLVPEVGWTLGRIIESVIEDTLAEFDVTGRGELPSGSAPVLEVGGELPSALPSVEDVARERLVRLAAEWDERATFNSDQGGGFWQGMTTKGRECADELRAVLALLPGRAEPLRHRGDPMTTTDPTPLAEQIAREHLAVLNTSTWLIVGCTCDPTLTAPPSGVGGSWYALHIATVTEQAVRERVTAEVRGQREAFLPSDTLDPAWIAGWHAAVDHVAAHIARGGTR